MRAEAWFVTLAPFPAVAVALLIGAYRGPWTSIKITGLILTILGLALLTVARFNLGDSFSISPRAKKLVTRGVYSRVRHPVYVFSTFLIAGLALYFHFYPLLIITAAIVPIQLIRARKEERVLEEAFGEEYRAYRRSTWF
jgi:protein-S-isoprenylcysteine O-methyltransferase Ste14